MIFRCLSKLAWRDYPVPALGPPGAKFSADKLCNEDVR